jgi:hypothetical protein
MAQTLAPLTLRRAFSTFPTGVTALAAVVGGKPVGIAGPRHRRRHGQRRGAARLSRQSGARLAARLVGPGPGDTRPEARILGPSGQDLSACDLVGDAGAGFGGGRVWAERGAQLHLFQ